MAYLPLRIEEGKNAENTTQTSHVLSTPQPHVASATALGSIDVEHFHHCCKFGWPVLLQAKPCAFNFYSIPAG